MVRVRSSQRSLDISHGVRHHFALAGRHRQQGVTSLRVRCCGRQPAGGSRRPRKTRLRWMCAAWLAGCLLAPATHGRCLHAAACTLLCLCLCLCLLCLCRLAAAGCWLAAAGAPACWPLQLAAHMHMQRLLPGCCCHARLSAVSHCICHCHVAWSVSHQPCITVRVAYSCVLSCRAVRLWPVRVHSQYIPASCGEIAAKLRIWMMTWWA
jgi:hypothetical protein